MVTFRVEKGTKGTCGRGGKKGELDDLSAVRQLILGKG